MVLRMLAHCHHGLLGHLKKTELSLTPLLPHVLFQIWPVKMFLLHHYKAVKSLFCLLVGAFKHVWDASLVSIWALCNIIGFTKFTSQKWTLKKGSLIDHSCSAAFQVLGFDSFPQVQFLHSLLLYVLLHKRDLSFFCFSVEFSCKELKWMNTIRG